MFVVGGKDGYVGRDARVTDAAEHPQAPGTPDA